MQDLALQVGPVDDVVVGDDQTSDPGGGEVDRRRRAEPAGADDQGPRAEQFLLARDIDVRQHDLPAVAQQLFVVHPLRRPVRLP
jgi:hypothetical protein